jgi:hemolysin activation/secretion protein
MSGLLLLGCALSESPARAGPVATNTYAISGYELRGNTVLEPAAIHSVFADAVGPSVSLAGLCRALAALRKTYQARGCPNPSVALPAQPLTHGVVVVHVSEGARSGADAPANPARPAPATFAVRTFEVDGNTLLPPKVIGDLLKSAVGPALTVEDVRRVAVHLQNAYRERGYATVAVSLPAQRLTNATVRLRVTEGALVAVDVTGNHYFSSNNILRALPGIRTNTLINSHVLQRELDAANQNRDRQIYPALTPGPDPGTSALLLRVKDRPPLHAHLELDDYATPGTPALRANAAAQYNNLWQREQQLGLAYSFTPGELKSIGNTPDYGFNQPLISSYSAFYRLPLPGAETIGEQIAGSPRFGYQEATHQFLLPPAGAAAELNFYASASASDTGVKWGAPSVVSQSSLLAVVSRDSGQNLVANQNLGGQFSFPLLTREHSRLRGFMGWEYKRSTVASFNTNNFFITTISTNLYGAQTNQSVTSSNQPARHEAVAYFPVHAGLDCSETDAGGATAVNLDLSGNLTGNNADFAAQSPAANARARFGKAALAASREQRLPGGGSLLARANGQAATGALINNEQLALGGINSVRGYYEGDADGDGGWCGSLELRSPYFETPVASLTQSVPAWLRAGIFTDGGQCLLQQPPPGTMANRWLWGAGFGLSANVNNHWDARVAIAWPLLSTANTPRGETRVAFTIGGQF